jgi:hypothetical protein
VFGKISKKELYRSQSVSCGKVIQLVGLTLVKFAVFSMILGKLWANEIIWIKILNDSQRKFEN